MRGPEEFATSLSPPNICLHAVLPAVYHSHNNLGSHYSRVSTAEYLLRQQGEQAHYCFTTTPRSDIRRVDNNIMQPYKFLPVVS